jgi:hypothetical protein
MASTDYQCVFMPFKIILEMLNNSVTTGTSSDSISEHD